MNYLLFVAAKVLVVVLGFLVALQAYRAYRRTESALMWYVAAGFVLVSVGGVIEGVLVEGLGVPLLTAGFAASMLIAAGLASVLYALYAPEP